MKQQTHIVIAGREYDLRERQVFIARCSLPDYQEMLDLNTRNRSLNRPHIGLIKLAVENNFWLFDGEPIVITLEGLLVEGQHRLVALYESGASVDLIIVLGVDKNAHLTRANARPRHIHGVLQQSGVVEGRLMTSITTRVLLRGKLKSSGKIPAQQYLSFLREHRGELDRSRLIAQRLREKSKLLSATLVGALHYLFSEKDSARASVFFTFLLDEPSNGFGGTPALRVLKKTLGLNRDSVAQLDQDHLSALCIKAWNLRESDCQLLKFIPLDAKRGGKTIKGEAFPIIE